jgi:hypothetical protein
MGITPTLLSSPKLRPPRNFPVNKTGAPGETSVTIVRAADGFAGGAPQHALEIAPKKFDWILPR